MMVKPISQAEARRYRAKYRKLEDILWCQRNGWASPDGTLVVQINDVPLYANYVRVARQLGHAVVVTEINGGTGIQLTALPHPKVGK